MAPRMVKASALRVGNVVSLGDGPWMTAVVEKIEYVGKPSPTGHPELRMVGFARPYMSTNTRYSGDMVHEDAGKVIALVGIEHFAVYGSDKESTSTYLLLDDREIK